MNSLADVLALTPGPSWHECVALVQEIAAHLEPGQPLPLVEDLLLDPDGVVTFGFAGESPRPQVSDLASLLATLLKKTDAPQGLRDLADENARDEPSHSSLASFTKALAFYERPNRQSDVRAVAGRLDAHSQSVQTEQILAELRERVARKSTLDSEPPSAKPAPQRTEKTDRERAIARARMLAIAAGVVMATAAVFGVSAMHGRSQNEAAKASVAAAPQPSPEAAASDDTAGKATDADRPSRDRRPVGTSATSRERKRSQSAPHTSAVSKARKTDRRQAGAHHASAAPFAGERLAPVGPLPPYRAPDGMSATNESSVARMPVSPVAGQSAARVASFERDPVEDLATYSSADHNVTPPMWQRRQLPSEPAPDNMTGYFDIVIDTNGDVESVRLISPTRRYEERMLMAAAKAWKFRPALLDGQPVKYRMRVPITLTWTIDR